MNFITQIMINAGTKLFVSLVNEKMVIWGFLKIAEGIVNILLNFSFSPRRLWGVCRMSARMFFLSWGIIAVEQGIDKTCLLE